jgi:hypothetical protein
VKIVQILVYGSTRLLTLVLAGDKRLKIMLRVSFSFCEPTIFHPGVWTASKSQLRKERTERTLAASLHGFMPLFIILVSSKRKDIFISHFRDEKCRFFCVFPTFLLPPPQERKRTMYTGKYRNQHRIRCFVTVNPVSKKPKNGFV